MMSANNVPKKQVLFGSCVRGEGNKRHFRLEGWSKDHGPGNSGKSRDDENETERDDGNAARDGGEQQWDHWHPPPHPLPPLQPGPPPPALPPSPAPTQAQKADNHEDVPAADSPDNARDEWGLSKAREQATNFELLRCKHAVVDQLLIAHCAGFKGGTLIEVQLVW